jgi:hypothetical protein
MGYTIIIFSGRGTKDLENRLEKLGIDTYDYINDNPEERQDNPGKVVASKYIDDKNIEFKGNWTEAISKLKGENMKKLDNEDYQESQEEMNEESEQVPPRAPVEGEEVKKLFGFGGKKKESSVPPLQSASGSRPNIKSQNPGEKVAKVEEPREIPYKTQEAAPKTTEYLREQGLVKEGETYPYLEAHLKEALAVLDKCPKTKDMSKAEKMNIVQETLNNINPVKEEVIPENIEKTSIPTKSEMNSFDRYKQKVDSIHSKVTGSPSTYQKTPVNKTEDPMEEIKAMLSGLTQKISTMESRMGGEVKKAEPVKTLPITMGQKKQEDKVLGGEGNKITKGDAEKIISNMISNINKKVVESPIEKKDIEEIFDMSSLASMKFSDVNKMASKYMGNRL